MANVFLGDFSSKYPLGVIVTYNPSPDFFERLNTFYTQFDQIILIDNGSHPDVCRLLKQAMQQRISSLNIIFNETNLGIATALNQGFSWALKQGYSKVVTFDQDSYPAPKMLQTMLEVFSTYADGSELAAVAPVVIDVAVSVRARYLRSRNKLLFERVSCNGSVLEDVTYVITSGTLYDLTAYQKIGPFRDDFFIDYVDTEYCLRAREKGYKIIVACQAQLNHRQGERQKRVFLGRDYYPSFHSPLRWYFISRNRIPMLRRYALRFPHWTSYELFASFYIFLKMLLFETQKMAKLRALLYGTVDGIRGQMGKVTDVRLKMVE